MKIIGLHMYLSLLFAWERNTLGVKKKSAFVSLAGSFSTLTPLPGNFACSFCCCANFNADFMFSYGTDFTENKRQHRALLLPADSLLAWLGVLRTLHLTIWVRSDTLTKRQELWKLVCLSGRCWQEISSSCLPISATGSRWSYRDVTNHVPHSLTTDPAAFQLGRCEGNEESLPLHQQSTALLHQGGVAGHCGAIPAMPRCC